MRLPVAELGTGVIVSLILGGTQFLSGVFVATLSIVHFRFSKSDFGVIGVFERIFVRKKRL